MKQLLLLVGILISAESLFSQEIVKWYTIEEAVALSLKEPKKIMVDVYTDWCGWCKVMDKQTFSDKEVAAYLNDNFYPVKFNAEQKDSVHILGSTFKYVSNGGRGVNELAPALLRGKLSYPTVAFISEYFQVLDPVPGFRKPPEFMQVLKHYSNMKVTPPNAQPDSTTAQ